SAEALRFSSLASSTPANGVSVRLGAMALNRIPARAYSAASDRVSPSTAPLAAATEAWYGIPWETAMVLKNTTEAFSEALSDFKEAFTTLTAPNRLTSMSRKKSSGFRLWKGFKWIDPGAYTNPSNLAGSPLISVKAVVTSMRI